MVEQKIQEEVAVAEIRNDMNLALSCHHVLPEVMLNDTYDETAFTDMQYFMDRELEHAR